MDDLKNLRDKIDKIDEELVKLFEERMDVVLKVGAYKKEKNLPIFNKDREEEVIEKNLRRLKNKNYKNFLVEILNSIMMTSKNFQLKEMNKGYLDKKHENNIKEKKHPVVGFQGCKGSFSEEALMGYFKDKVDSINYDEFEDVFCALDKGEIEYGVLPIENSSTGGIGEIYELLRKYDCFILGEKNIKIHQNLLGIKGAKIEDINEVYSHPEAFKQSNKFLKKYKEWEVIPYKNTAMSAQYIGKQNNKSKGAIGSKIAAEIYKLEIIKENINFNEHNYTRFIVIGKEIEIDENANKISIIISCPHKVGALYNILKHFYENKMNMLKIESKPIVGKNWECFFYIDFEGNLKEKGLMDVMKIIEENTTYFKLLGNYRNG